MNDFPSTYEERGPDPRHVELMEQERKILLLIYGKELSALIERMKEHGIRFSSFETITTGLLVRRLVLEMPEQRHLHLRSLAYGIEVEKRDPNK